MLTVCIPVYNTSALMQAESLLAQVAALEGSVEIIFLDDGSDPEFREKNAFLKSMQGVRYYEQENAGRAAARNRLAELATGAYLLFVDSDCIVPEGFLKRYLRYCAGNCVVVGGLVYPPRPQDRKLRLRWKVGVRREQRSLEERRSKPYVSFLSSNFLIDRSLFGDHCFNNDLSNYGHEDTLFGYNLSTHGLEITHIENPVIHIGLDSADVYLRKIKESTGNLLYFWEQGYDISPFRVLCAFSRIKKHGLAGPFAALFNMLRVPIYMALTGCCPSLFLFDVYKLGLFCLAWRQSKK